MILFVSNADTELLALRMAAEALPEGMPPVRGCSAGDSDDFGQYLPSVSLVVVRLLGGSKMWSGGLEELRSHCTAKGVPFLVFGGEAVYDDDLESYSTVSSHIARSAFPYLAEGGPENMANMLEFLCRQLLDVAVYPDPPVRIPPAGYMHVRYSADGRDGTVKTMDGACHLGWTHDNDSGGGDPAGRRPRVGIIAYRAQVLAGNVSYIAELCSALTHHGADPVPVFAYSLRSSWGGPRSGMDPGDEMDPGGTAVALLGSSLVDAVITTTMSSGAYDGEIESFDAYPLCELDVPVLQGICSLTSMERFEASTMGLSPVDVAMSVAMPEVDGRVITVPFSFKEVVDDDEVIGAPITAYRCMSDRVDRVASIAARMARLGQTPASAKRVAIVLSAYPTAKSRLGNAVGLDTPRSVIDLLRAMNAAGYTISSIPASGDDLMHQLADGLIYEDYREYMPSVDGASSPSTPISDIPQWVLNAEQYHGIVESLDEGIKSRIVEQWGDPARDRGQYRFCGLDLGNVIVAVQPPRGYGDNPVAIYHSPDLSPTHHYMAFYRWLDEVWGADAIVHMGKHGTLEWLPGKGVGLSASCAPDAVLGSMPLIYPFVVNDPGEGVQAKRRSHAVIVDHLVPPLTEAGSYGATARLETLLDEHARANALDPGKLPAIREMIAEIMIEEHIHRDLDMHSNELDHENPDRFDSLLPVIDGYLCELKDAQIRGGLHVLGLPPSGAFEIDMIMAITRLAQGNVPSLRDTLARLLGYAPSASGSTGEHGEHGEHGSTGEHGEPLSVAPLTRAAVDEVDEQTRQVLLTLQGANWNMDVGVDQFYDRAVLPLDAHSHNYRSAALSVAEELRSPQETELKDIVRWVCNKLVPRLHATAGEIDSILHALSGGFVMPGPSGAPSRGMASVLPTGRNFYSSDPRAIPSPLAWETGNRLAMRLVERYLGDEGRYPLSVGIVVWGTATMRTMGDDIAQALALIGVRPCWEKESGRVVALEVIPLEELGRPRVDVVLRISGLFRDAFANVIALFDAAVAMVAALDEPPDVNPVRASGLDDPRVFGPKPGAYGSGVLDLIGSGKWEDSADLAAVYIERSSYSYAMRAGGQDLSTSSVDAWWNHDLDARYSNEALKRKIAALDVASKNQDNREHDIFDSDDYLQDHGGLVAAIRELAGKEPRSYFGDSSDPAAPRVRSLDQEAARVLRSRVVNPKWIESMKRHGYKGAFEMAATVDYMFGYDATAHIVDGWMYEKVTEAYVASRDTRDFFARSNPWALKAIVERLFEAVQREMWEPSADAIDALRTAMLEAEGWEEDRMDRKR